MRRELIDDSWMVCIDTVADPVLKRYLTAVLAETLTVIVAHDRLGRTSRDPELDARASRVRGDLRLLIDVFEHDSPGIQGSLQPRS